MYVKICPWCKSKFYSATKETSNYHRDCKSKKAGKKRTQERTFRTSTPVPDREKVASSFSDSVLDFFYQTWKSGLLSESKQWSTKQEYTPKSYNELYQNHAPAPVYYASAQVCTGVNFCMGTFVCQSPAPAMGVYLQPVGYRPDGTFGVLPFYWPCIVQ